MYLFRQLLRQKHSTLRSVVPSAMFLLPRDKLGYALSLKWVKSIVLMMFTAYLVVAIWGITGLKEGLEKRNTVNFDSYSIPFFDADDKYYMVRAPFSHDKVQRSPPLMVGFYLLLLLGIPAFKYK